MNEVAECPVSSGGQRQQMESFRSDIRAESLAPLWDVLSQLVTPTPRSSVQAHLWHFDTVRTHLMRAGELITAEQAERRVLVLENPGLPGKSCITSSLYAGIQLVLPGETAPCHRHSQSALRFVLEGNGGYTIVDGEPIAMAPFDLVLTPNDCWHDHANPTDKPMIWLDGLDLPTVTLFDASFGEKLPEASSPRERPEGDALRRFGRNLAPLGGGSHSAAKRRNVMFHYPHAEWLASLKSIASVDEPDPHFGYALEFTNPVDGGPLMDTIAAHVRLLPKGFHTKERRATDGTVFAVVAGTGTATIEGADMPLGPRDIFVVPSWKALTLKADDELVLFGYSDRSAQQKLGLFREQLA